MGPISDMERRYGSLAKASAASGETTERHAAGARYDRFRSFPGGMIELVKGLADAIPAGCIHLNSTVKSIQRDNGRFRLNAEPSVAQADPGTFDHLILTTPSAITAQLICDIAPVAAKELQAIESTSTAIVVLGVLRTDIRDDISTFGFVVPPIEGRRILAGSFSSNKFAGRANEEHVLIRCFIGGALQRHLLDRSDDELIRIAREELADLIGLNGSPLVERVIRWNNAMPQYHVGHLERVDRIEREIAAIPGLSLVSNSLHGVGIAAVVRAADQVATNVISSFTQSGNAPDGGAAEIAATR